MEKITVVGLCVHCDHSRQLLFLGPLKCYHCKPITVSQTTFVTCVSKENVQVKWKNITVVGLCVHCDHSRQLLFLGPLKCYHCKPITVSQTTFVTCVSNENVKVKWKK